MSRKRKRIPLDALELILRSAARKNINARLDSIGISRTELAALLGVADSYLNKIIAGHGPEATQTRRLLEVAIAAPIWSKPEDFAALTRVLKLQAMSLTTPKQVAAGSKSPKKQTQ